LGRGRRHHGRPLVSRHERYEEVRRSGARGDNRGDRSAKFCALQCIFMEHRVSLREINQHLTRYVKAAEAGERIVITRRGNPVVAATPASLRLAMRAVERHGLAFWDALQWAVAKQSGATLLLSEDLQHDRELDGVRFRNPFLADDPFAG